MFKYLLKRLFLFLPTLLVISLVAFALSKLAPGDPVELLLKGQGGAESNQEARSGRYEEVAKRLNLDLPNFYCALTSAAYPDTLHKVAKKIERETLSNLIGQYGNWPQIAEYYNALRNLEIKAAQLPNNPADSALYTQRNTLLRNTKELLITHKDNLRKLGIESLQTLLNDTIITDTQTKTAINEVIQANTNMLQKTTPQKHYYPALHWYGLNNQYHKWISAFFVGDFGTSYMDSRPVASKIWDALRWTLLINVISILLAYLIAIPIGVTTAIKKDTAYDRIVTTSLFMLYSLPNFWIGTMLIVFLTTAEYSPFLDWFPTGGITDLPKSTPFFTRFADILYHLILPIFCVTYGSFAFISRQMRGGMLTVIRQDYIRTAYAKGLEQKAITWKHAFRNSLFPIITLFAYIFPAAIAGAVTIEVIYSIPGMGKLAIDSISARDWPVVFTILMFAAILTMIGNLVADILYAFADPRVSYGGKGK
ncbi:MAG: ABC transporter permease [Sphingobacteriales bacterium]|jgi:peptide/nickel transport system permease protein|nr:ABC transporter permease [Sphingobacteriales bacterium]MBP9140587.1 ABC transporter permease [Chitinophagales bacterium]MDA0197377.1 ABC transporter permease [Bacteroidota bacterium]MBK6888673.1 ABC transporter permease [Sphingobacteriales bacterium]MBK7528818.1 ABC transporter permease [Sphingobacteriales bacterium]